MMVLGDGMEVKFDRTFLNELVELVKQIDLALEHLYTRARDQGVAPYVLQNRDGSMAVAGLLVAKARAMNAMSNIPPNMILKLPEVTAAQKQEIIDNYTKNKGTW